MNFDDNALYRHPELESLRDPSQEDPREAEAKAHELSYISLDGNIGCMVNGAGLAMATMDLVQLHGGSPANFLDVGGGTTAERVAEAFKIILSHENVKAVLINIFGGILRCDVLAQGVVEAARKTGLQVPVVVRMEGTNVEEGRRLLASSGLSLTVEVRDPSGAIMRAPPTSVRLYADGVPGRAAALALLRRAVAKLIRYHAD